MKKPLEFYALTEVFSHILMTKRDSKTSRFNHAVMSVPCTDTVNISVNGL